MAGERTQLGEAVIKVSVDSTGVGPGVSSAVADANKAAGTGGANGAIHETTEATTKLTDATTKATPAVRSFGETIRFVRAGMAGYASVITSIIGVVGYFVRKQEEATKALRDSYEAARKWKQGLEEASDEIGRSNDLEALTKQYDSVYSRYEKLRQAAREDQKLRGQQLQDTLRAINEAQNREFQTLQSAINREIGLNEVRSRGQLQWWKKTEEEKTRIKKEEDDKRAAEDEARREREYQRELEQAQRIADAVERAFTNAIQNTRDKSAGLFNVGEITNSIELIGQKLDAISRNTRSRL